MTLKKIFQHDEVSDRPDHRIITFQELKEILSDWEVGDILIDEDGGEIKILSKVEVLGETVYLVSSINNFDVLDTSSIYTKEEYEEEGWKLKPKKIKLTKKQIAEKFNIDEDQLEIE